MNTKEKLIQHMKENGLSQTQMGRILGISATVINLYLNGKYSASEKFEVLLDDFFKEKNREAKENNSEVLDCHFESGFAETVTVKSALDLLKLTHLEGGMSVLYGGAGLGKTTILKKYIEKNRDSTIFIEADSTHTPKVILSDICKALGLPVQGVSADKLNAIIEKIKGLKTRLLIVIDEAELLTYKTLEILRRLHDKSGAGLVLAGMPRLIVNLTGIKGQYVQLFSRIDFAFEVGRNNALSEQDIAQIARSILPELTDELIKELYQLAGGNARRIFKLLRGSVRTAELNGREVDIKLLRQFSSMLIK